MLGGGALLLLVATVVLPQGTADVQPYPGDFVVINELYAKAGGGCEGNVTLMYGLLPLDIGHQMTATVDDDCGVRPGFGWEAGGGYLGINYFGYLATDYFGDFYGPPDVNQHTAEFTGLGCEVLATIAEPIPGSGWTAVAPWEDEGGTPCSLRSGVGWLLYENGIPWHAYREVLFTRPGDWNECWVSNGADGYVAQVECRWTPDGSEVFDQAGVFGTVAAGTSGHWTVERP